MFARGRGCEVDTIDTHQRRPPHVPLLSRTRTMLHSDKTLSLTVATARHDELHGERNFYESCVTLHTL